MRNCITCLKRKNIQDFYIINPKTGNRSTCCKVCQLIKSKDWYNKNKESVRKNSKLRRENSPIYKNYQKNGRRKSYLIRKYGITEEEYKKIKKLQGGVCKICEMECIFGKELSVDHCHKTGKIRGLLCRKCNIGLGYFDDDTKKLSKAMKYLKISVL